MAFEQRDMQGAIFKNDNRETDKHPNANGTCMIEGVEYYISAWTKDGKNGKFQSLAFKRKDGKSKAKPAETGGTVNDLDDDIPF